VAATEAEATYPHAADAHAQQVAQLEKQRGDTREEVKRLEAELASLQADREALNTGFDELRQKSEELEKLVAEVEPKTRLVPFKLLATHLQCTVPEGSTKSKSKKCVVLTVENCRHQLSLYAHISKVTWQFDAADRIAGAVSDDVTGDIRHFDIDPESMSKFEIANQLWDLMERV
jgi:kinetochore protein Spc24